jgi:hypothetical protein
MFGMRMAVHTIRAALQACSCKYMKPNHTLRCRKGARCMCQTVTHDGAKSQTVTHEGAKSQTVTHEGAKSQTVTHEQVPRVRP